jgi:hypothetical protein
VPPRRRGRFRRLYRRHDQIVDHRPHSVDRRTIGGRQGAGGVIVYLAVQRRYSIGDVDLNVLAIQCRLSADLGLNVAADLLVSPGGGGCGAAAAGARVACSAGWSLTKGFLQPTPRTRKPVKTVSGMLRRIRKAVFMGILGFRLVRRHPSLLAIECFSVPGGTVAQ